MDDRTSKKALVFEMVNAYSGFRLPNHAYGGICLSIVRMGHLLFTFHLCSTMPQHIWNLSYIMPQKTVCNNKYYIDFALCDRKTGKVQIGIECDGFHIHL
ncbi:MAG: hypothetical protein ACLTE2_01195 [Eubacteriales bacterium]